MGKFDVQGLDAPVNNNIPTSSNNFLNGISRNQTHGRQPGTNGDEQQQRRQADPTRRHFAAQVKSIEDIFNEHRQMNIGPVRQSQLPVQVYNDIDEQAYPQEEFFRSFHEVNLTEEIRKNLIKINYEEPTDVQKCVISLVQKTNSDVLCLAQTGSGKTGAFLIPIIHRLQGLRTGPQGEAKPVNMNAPLAIIMAHTKELVEQLWRNALALANGTGVGVALARGSMPRNDSLRQLANGCDLLVMTPGRLHQYLADEWIRVDSLQFIVIDEADKFISEDDLSKGLYQMKQLIERANNSHVRTLLFSATLNDVAEMLVCKLLKPNFYHVEAGRVNLAAQHVRQLFLEVEYVNKRSLRSKQLIRILKKHSRQVEPEDEEHFCYETERTVIFVNEKRFCDRVAIMLSSLGYKAMSVNGHRSMEQRCRAITEFNSGKWHILVGTDVVARGMNFPQVKNVILYELPPIERYMQYVHRVGRTGRVGSDDGLAYVFFDTQNPNDIQLTEFLVDQLRQCNQTVPPFLLQLEQAHVEQLQLIEASKRPNIFEQNNDEDVPMDEGFCNLHWNK